MCERHPRRPPVSRSTSSPDAVYPPRTEWRRGRARSIGHSVFGGWAEQLYGWDAPLDSHRIFGADDAAILSWFSAPFGEALGEALVAEVGWGSVTLADGTLELRRALIDGRPVEQAAAIAAPMLDHVRALLGAIPTDPDLARRLGARARSPRECDEVHWRATRALFTHHASSPQLKRLFEEVADLPEYTRVALAVWGPDLFDADTHYALLSTGSMAFSTPDFQRDAHTRQLREHAWMGLTAPYVSSEERLEFARHAWSSGDAPGDLGAREGALLDLSSPTTSFPTR